MPTPTPQARLAIRTTAELTKALKQYKQQELERIKQQRAARLTQKPVAKQN